MLKGVTGYKRPRWRRSETAQPQSEEARKQGGKREKKKQRNSFFFFFSVNESTADVSGRISMTEIARLEANWSK